MWYIPPPKKKYMYRLDSRMKQKQLEIFLQQVPSHPTPIPHLEQYQTPASVAADILFTAFHFQDIKECHLADYGCGTGIFATGAVLLGAKISRGGQMSNDPCQMINVQGPVIDIIKLINEKFTIISN